MAVAAGTTTQGVGGSPLIGRWIHNIAFNSLELALGQTLG